MGWWGFGPMEGDEPLDCECFIAEAVGHDMLGDAQLVISTAEQIEAVLNKLKDVFVGAQANEIYWHTLAVVVMRSGGPLSMIRDRVLQAIDADEWSTHEPRRLEAMRSFRASVQGYVDGKPYKEPSKGLFDAFFEHMNAGKTGLVNV